jgi:release factor glutamine methyltransferase
VQQLADGPHADRARQDAELLLCHVLGRNKAWLISNPDADLERGQAEAYQSLLARRLAGEPIQYILGETEFYGLPFRVTRDVLIPRPETEYLVEKALELARHIDQPRLDNPRIVDIGTGSGAIAVALAHHLPEAEVTAIDISPAPLAIARQNARRNDVDRRIRFVEGDLFTPVADERFDIVVSNPPYVPTVDRASLSVEVRDFEPSMALFAGEDGLDVYRRLIPAAYTALVPSGFLLLEIGFGQAEAMERLLIAAGFQGVEFTPDLQGIARVARAQRVGASRSARWHS